MPSEPKGCGREIPGDWTDVYVWGILWLMIVSDDLAKNDYLSSFSSIN